MRCRGIVFDLDGTLVDSLPEVHACLNKTLVESGRRTLTLDQVRRLIGDGARATVARAFANTGESLGEADLGCAVDRYLVHYRHAPAVHTRAFDHVDDVLRSLTEQHFKMGICTNKPSATTGTVLDSLHLSKYFAAVVCGDQLPYPKPDGRHVRATLDAMGCDGAHSIMVGDSENDMTAGRAAGLPTIAVRYGYCPGPIENLGATAVIDSFSDLPATLLRLYEERERT